MNNSILGQGWTGRARAVCLVSTVMLIAAMPSSVVAQTPSPSPHPSDSVPDSAGGVAGGAITYMREDPGGNWQVWLACPELTDARQLTAVEGRDSGWPVFSPDGTRIAFDSNREDPNPDDDSVINDIFTMGVGGADLRKLTDSTALAGDPAYSPDGSLLAFESDEGGTAPEGIFVMDASDGSGKRRVTTLPADASWDGAPRFSPDGARLVFTREISDTAAALYVVALDGSDLRRITPGTLKPGDATWSPDGSEIVFEADLVGGRGDTWVVGRDGEGLRNLTAGTNPPGQWEGFADPVWLPGEIILLLHGYHVGGEVVHAGLATIRPDGTGLAYVADGDGEEHQPDESEAASCPLDE